MTVRDMTRTFDVTIYDMTHWCDAAIVDFQHVYITPRHLLI